MGLDVYMYRFENGPPGDGDDYEATERKCVELPSQVHPEHYFKIGYMRSSYNDGGINGILRGRIGTDLYGIFANDGETYYSRPDWGEAKVRAAKALADLRAYEAEHGCYRVWTVTHNPFAGPQTLDRDGALALFVEERKKFRADDKNGYSNKHGAFVPRGLTLYGAVVGMDSLGSPGVHLIYGGEDADFTFYEQALEVVIEMCEWVMGQPDREKLWLAWSS